MRCLLVLVLLAFNFSVQSQNIVPKYLELNEKVPNLNLEVLRNGKLEQVPLSNYLGQVVILEFWATFCGPCIPAMDHLAGIQNELPADVIIFAITEEPASVVEKYLKKRPTSLDIVLDPNGELNRLFYHQFMPHTVLIGTDGYIKAITSPDQITKETIYITKSGADPAIELKSEFKPVEVKADALGVVNFEEETILKVNLSPAQEGVQAQVRKISETEYQFVNCTIPVIYNSLVQNIRGNKLPKDCLEVGIENQSLLKTENSYCFEIKVPANLQYEIEKIGLRHIESVFQLEPVIEPRKRNALILNSKAGFEPSENLTALKAFTSSEVADYLWQEKLIPLPIALDGSERAFRGSIPSQVPEVQPFLEQNGYELTPQNIEKQCLILHKEGATPSDSNNF